MSGEYGNYQQKLPPNENYQPDPTSSQKQSSLEKASSNTTSSFRATKKKQSDPRIASASGLNKDNSVSKTISSTVRSGLKGRVSNFTKPRRTQSGVAEAEQPVPADEDENKAMSKSRKDTSSLARSAFKGEEAPLPRSFFKGANTALPPPPLASTMQPHPNAMHPSNYAKHKAALPDPIAQAAQPKDDPKEVKLNVKANVSLNTELSKQLELVDLNHTTNKQVADIITFFRASNQEANRGKMLIITSKGSKGERIDKSRKSQQQANLAIKNMLTILQSKMTEVVAKGGDPGSMNFSTVPPPDPNKPAPAPKSDAVKPFLSGLPTLLSFMSDNSVVASQLAADPKLKQEFESLQYTLATLSGTTTLNSKARAWQEHTGTLNKLAVVLKPGEDFSVKADNGELRSGKTILGLGEEKEAASIIEEGKKYSKKLDESFADPLAPARNELQASLDVQIRTLNRSLEFKKDFEKKTTPTDVKRYVYNERVALVLDKQIGILMNNPTVEFKEVVGALKENPKNPEARAAFATLMKDNEAVQRAIIDSVYEPDKSVESYSGNNEYFIDLPGDVFKQDDQGNLKDHTTVKANLFTTLAKEIGVIEKGKLEIETKLKGPFKSNDITLQIISLTGGYTKREEPAIAAVTQLFNRYCEQCATLKPPEESFNKDKELVQVKLGNALVTTKDKLDAVAQFIDKYSLSTNEEAQSAAPTKFNARTAEITRSEASFAKSFDNVLQIALSPTFSKILAAETKDGQAVLSEFKKTLTDIQPLQEQNSKALNAIGQIASPEERAVALAQHFETPQFDTYMNQLINYAKVSEKLRTTKSSVASGGKQPSLQGRLDAIVIGSRVDQRSGNYMPNILQNDLSVVFQRTNRYGDLLAAAAKDGADLSPATKALLTKASAHIADLLQQLK